MLLRPFALAACLGAAACASTTRSTATSDASSGARPPGGKLEVVRHVDRVTPPKLAGARCADGTSCVCRTGDAEETSPPAEGMKRFEARLSTDGGEATLRVPGIGALGATGVKETCFYFDLPAGAPLSVIYASRASEPQHGFTPKLTIAEYGASGAFWYDAVVVDCVGSDGRCDKEGARRWADRARQNKRGRVDPCGSSVASKIHWETTRAESRRDGGRFHDLTVTFDFEVKTFAPRFAPGSTECIPK